MSSEVKMLEKCPWDYHQTCTEQLVLINKGLKMLDNCPYSHIQMRRTESPWRTAVTCVYLLRVISPLK